MYVFPLFLPLPTLLELPLAAFSYPVPILPGFAPTPCPHS